MAWLGSNRLELTLISKGKEMAKKSTKLIALLLMIACFFGLLAFNSVVLFYNMEAMGFYGMGSLGNFDPSISSDAAISKMYCPRFIGEGEIKKAWIEVKNTGDEPIKPFIQAMLSYPGVWQKYLTSGDNYPIEPGETAIREWGVNERYMVDGNYVLVRFFVHKSPAYPASLTQACKILRFSFLGLPSELGGNFTFALLNIGFVLSAVWFTSQDDYWLKRKRPRTTILYLIATSALMSIATLSNTWVLGLIGFILIVMGLLLFFQQNWT